MTSGAKLTIRPLPHLDFIAGFPGIAGDASRTSAHITGNIEVRLGSRGAKASFLRIELRKLESVAGGETWGELVGRGPTVVWSARPGPGAGDREEDAEGSWELLQTADFPFRIPIPEGLPPTAKLDKQCGISYELVTSLCVKGKKGLLRSSATSSIVQSTHPIALEKHELHSTWPIYHIPDEHSDENDGVKARVERTQTCYGPGDTVSVKVFVFSTKVAPIKLKSVAFSVRETITFRGGSNKPNRLSSFGGGGGGAAASQRTETLAQKSKTYGKKMYKDEEQEFTLTCQIPKSHSLMTIQTAKHIEVSYTMRVYVDVSKAPIVIDHLPLTITTFPSALSKDVCNRIGFVQGLSRNNYTDDAYSTVVSDRQSVSGHNGHSASSRAPAVQRSQSYGSSGASSGGIGRYGMGSDLRRRDTVMTQGTAVSGPGMAGFGVPGQLFSWGDMGAAQAYNHDGPGAVRPKFAGPPSIYERPELHLEESRAMFHSANMSENAALLGVSSDTLSGPGVYAAGSGAQSRFNLQRSPFETISESPTPNPHHSPASSPPPGPGGAALAAQQAQLLRYANANASRQSIIRRPQSAGASAVSEAPSDTAEQEKMRLYQRAREQAERNQRRADEKRRKQAAAAALGQGGTLDTTSGSLSPSTLTSSQSAGAIAALSAANLAASQNSGYRNVSAPLPGSAAYTNAANEKARLYERARREAERYQNGFEQGATFPKEALEGNENGAAAQGSSKATPAAGGRSSPSARFQAPSAAGTKEDDRRSSAAYWMAAGGGGAAASSTAGAPQPAGSVPTYSTPSGPSTTPKPPGSWLSAEEEKRRLYETAKAQQAAAEQEARLASQPPGGHVDSRALTGVSAPNAASNIAAEAPGYLTAEQEKNRLYERAKAEQAAAEADARARSEAPAMGPGGSSQSNNPSVASLNGTSTSFGPSASSRDEKAQLRLYYEAQDAVARAQQASQTDSAQPGAAGPAVPNRTSNFASDSSKLAGSSGSRAYQPYETAPVPAYHQATSSEISLPHAGSLLAGGSQLNNRQSLYGGALPRSVGVSPLSTPPAPQSNTQRSSYIGGQSGSHFVSAAPPPPPPGAGPPSSSASGMSEKEQMRLYYAARDAQLEAENEAALAGSSVARAPPGAAAQAGQGSPSNSTSASAFSSLTPAQAPPLATSAGPTLSRPSASYAPGYTRPGDAAPIPLESSPASSAQQRSIGTASTPQATSIASHVPAVAIHGSTAAPPTLTSTPQMAPQSTNARPMSMANYRPLPDAMPGGGSGSPLGSNKGPTAPGNGVPSPPSARSGPNSYGSLPSQQFPGAHTIAGQSAVDGRHERLASHSTIASTITSDLPHHDPSIAAGKQRSMSPRIDQQQRPNHSLYGQLVSGPPAPAQQAPIGGLDGLSQLNTSLPPIDFGNLSPLQLRAGTQPLPAASSAHSQQPGVSSPPTSSIYSPKYAKRWDDEEEDEEAHTPRAANGGKAAPAAVPPPLPPKTRIG